MLPTGDCLGSMRFPLRRFFGIISAGGVDCADTALRRCLLALPGAQPSGDRSQDQALRGIGCGLPGMLELVDGRHNASTRSPVRHDLEHLIRRYDHGRSYPTHNVPRRHSCVSETAHDVVATDIRWLETA